MVAALVVVALVLAWAGKDGTVFAADDETVTDGAVEADMVGLAVETVLALVGFDGLAWNVLTVVTVVAVVEEDAKVGEAVAGLVAVAETFWVAAGVEVTVAGADVTAGGVDADEDVFDITLVAVVIVGAGIDVGTALTAA